MEKKSVFSQIFKQLFLLIWKLFLMVVLIAGRIITMVVSIMNTKIEEYLKVQKQNL